MSNMKEREIRHALTEILYSAVNGIDGEAAFCEGLTSEDTEALYALAKNQDVAHILFRFIHNNNVAVESGLLEKLQREELLSIYRYGRMKYALEEICDALDKANIEHLLLKGAVIRPYYPYETMRTSCDIDVLIHENDVKAAVCELEGKGYRCESRNYHDVSLYSPENVHLELHFNIRENMRELDSVLDEVWSYTEVTDEGRLALKKEFFVFHMYAHMAYHFTAGGCGIRALMDIWIMEHRMKAAYGCAKELLERAGIYRFAEKMSALANKCFTDNETDDFSEQVLEYIYRGGIYGSLENKVAVATSSKKSSPLRYALGRIFPPYKLMAVSYPILKKAPYLLPLCWIARCIRALFEGKSGQFSSELTYVSETTDEKRTEIKEMRSHLGLE